MGNNKYDIAIIGSGLGGLVCAYVLAKNGKKVLVVEKNPQIGGCLQCFRRFGVKFDTGMHYLGSMDEGQILHRFFKYLNLLNDVKINRLDPDRADVFSIGDHQYAFASGLDNFVHRLSEDFPSEKDHIRSYALLIQDIALHSPLYDLRRVRTSDYADSPYLRTSVNELIASFTDNKLLQNVLAANIPYYGGVKDKTPFYIHALTSYFYMQSAWVTVGGSDSIAQSLAKSIRNFGGEIITKSEVSEIVCDASKATHLRLSNGEIIDSDLFISDIHPSQTLKLLKTKIIRPVYRHRIQNIENTPAYFSIYLKFKEKEVPFMNYNYGHYDIDDVWNSYGRKTGEAISNYLFMHQCVEQNQKYAESAEILTTMPFAEVSKWAGLNRKQNSEYQDFKIKKAEEILAIVENQFPNLRKSIEQYATSTPLTYADYTATPCGSTYGILHDKSDYDRTHISQRTKIPNLLLTGQNIHWHGIIGVIVGAFLCCTDILGLDQMIVEIG